MVPSIVLRGSGVNVQKCLTGNTEPSHVGPDFNTISNCEIEPKTSQNHPEVAIYNRNLIFQDPINWVFMLNLSVFAWSVSVRYFYMYFYHQHQHPPTIAMWLNPRNSPFLTSKYSFLFETKVVIVYIYI